MKYLSYKLILLVSFIFMAFFMTAGQAFAADVIGVRVIENEQRLSPFTWYRQNVPNPGNPESLTVDGYQALQQGRTVYAFASNLINGELTPYVYVISYNQDPGEETLEIFAKVLANLRFNTNINDASTRQKIRNDVKRAGDIQDIQTALDAYRSRNGSYPRLQSGSYISGLSFSAWPSWQSTLGGVLQTPLPVDPINTFQQCREPFDGQTCWDETTQRFQCPPDSNVYAFQSQSSGDDVRVLANFEYPAWKTGEYATLVSQSCFNFEGAFANDLDGDSVLNSGDNCSQVTNPDQADADNDGIGDACDVCVLDPTNDRDRDGVCGNADNCPNVNNPDQLDIDADGVGDACDVVVCGNGIKEGFEQCDGLDGLGAHQACRSNCTIQDLTYCGDGLIQSPNQEQGIAEQCDGSGFDGSSATRQYSCTSQCALTGGWCGDGIVNGPEVCDGSAGAVANGVCAANCRGFVCEDGYYDDGRQCVPDGDGDILPDTIDNCPNISNPNQLNADGDAFGDACDWCPLDPDNDFDNDGVCVGPNNPDFADKRSGFDNCPRVGNQSQVDSDGDGLGDACDFQTCGNGIVEEGEVCDQARGTSENDQWECINNCTQRAGGWCGDNQINSTYEECEPGLVSIVSSDYGSSITNQYECNQCRWDGGWCGDGIVQIQRGEVCDGAGSGSGELTQYECTNNCTQVSGGYCGDGIVQPEFGEQCDSGANIGRACTPSGQNACSFCSNTCQNRVITPIYVIAERQRGFSGYNEMWLCPAINGTPWPLWETTLSRPIGLEETGHYEGEIALIYPGPNDNCSRVGWTGPVWRYNCDWWARDPNTTFTGNGAYVKDYCQTMRERYWTFTGRYAER